MRVPLERESVSFRAIADIATSPMPCLAVAIRQTVVIKPVTSVQVNCPTECMTCYRLLYLDPNDDIVHSLVFQSRSDPEAVHIAESRRTLTGMELWDDGRLVKRWDHFPPKG